MQKTLKPLFATILFWSAFAHAELPRLSQIAQKGWTCLAGLLPPSPNVGLTNKSWKVTGGRRDWRYGGFQLELTPLHPEKLTFFEGNLHLIVQKYPLLSGYGYQFRNGLFFRPDFNSQNSRLKRRKDFNGLLSEPVAGHVTHFEIVKLFSQRKVIWAQGGDEFFHDSNVHGLGYILFPRHLVDYLQKLAALIVDLRTFNEGSLEVFVRPYVYAFASQVDNYSDNLGRSLLLPGSSRARFAEDFKTLFKKYYFHKPRYDNEGRRPVLTEMVSRLRELLDQPEYSTQREAVLNLLNRYRISDFSLTDAMLDEMEEKHGPAQPVEAMIMSGLVPLFVTPLN